MARKEITERFTTFEQAADFVRGMRILGITQIWLCDEGSQFSVTWLEDDGGLT
jgi:hypothetical protein